MLLLGLAAWLRAASLFEPLWLDELHTAWIVAGDLQDVAPRAMVGNQSPLIYWPWWGWAQLFGITPVTLRLPLLATGLALVVLVYLIVRRTTDSMLAAVTAALLVVLNDSCVFYAVEARVYALVQFMALVHVGLLAATFERPTLLRRACWFLTGGLLLHLHYTTGLVLLAEWFAYALVWYRRREALAYGPRHFLLDSSLILLGLLPVLPHMATIAGRRQNWAHFIERSSPLLILWVVPLAWYVVLPGLCLAALRAMSPRDDSLSTETRPPDNAWLTLLVALAVVPTTTAWLLTQLDLARVFTVRYLNGSLVAPMVLGGMIVALARLRWQQGVLVLLMVGLALGTGDAWREVILDRTPPVGRAEAWDVAVEQLNHALQSSDKPVFVYSGLIECDSLSPTGDDLPLFREFCLLPVMGPYRLDVPAERLHPLRYSHPGRLNPRESRLASDGAWFVLRGALGKEFQHQVGQSLRAAGVQGPFRWRVQSAGHVHWLRLDVERAGS